MAKALTGIKVLFVLAQKDFREEEIAAPRKILEEAGATCLMASPEGGEVTGMGGKSIMTISVTEPRNVDIAGGIVFGGAGAATSLWANMLVHKQLRMIERDRKPLAAVGLGVVVLAKAGLLEKRKATVYVTSDALKALKEGGAIYEKKPLVIDRDVITADGDGSAERLATIFRETLVQKKEQARR